MSVLSPAFIITRKPVPSHDPEWVKMFDPPTASPSTPEKMTPTNPVPEVMAAAGYQNTPGISNTVDRQLLQGLTLTTWDGLKKLLFFTLKDGDNPTLNNGSYPAGTIRVPRGVIFHGKTHGKGPPPHTIHWHGIEPTPINDGVGHCSMEIGDYTYQWQPNFIGTYFYHCHRNTVQHFEFGLFGYLLIEPPDAYFATQRNPAIPIGHCRDGKRRTAANLANFSQFPGFNSNQLTASDTWSGDTALKFQTDPHAMTVPYDVEALWVLDDRDSVWSDLAPDARATFPAHGDKPGENDEFHKKPGSNGFFAFNQYNADYWFVTGVPVPAARGGTGTIPAGVVIPPAANSGVTGSQISIEAKVGQTILVRCLDAAYNSIEVTFPVDVVVIAWDGRALGVPPYGFNDAYLVSAGTPIRSSTARRFDALIRAVSPVSSFATVKFIDTRGESVGSNENVVMTARIPVNITALSAAGFRILGSVVSETGAALVGVTMTLTGDAVRTAVTDSAGFYSFEGLPNGTYTVAVSVPGFTFLPASRIISISGSDAAGHNFVRASTAAGGLSISGSVFTSRGVAITGVLMTLSGAANQVTVTDSLGNYKFAGLAAGSYMVEPSLGRFRFSPGQRKVVVKGANVISQFFRGREL